MERIPCQQERSLGRIEGKLDAMQETMAAIGQKVDGVDSRLRNVERRTALQSGAISAAVSTGVALVAAKLGIPPTA